MKLTIDFPDDFPAVMELLDKIKQLVDTKYPTVYASHLDELVIKLLRKGYTVHTSRGKSVGWCNLGLSREELSQPMELYRAFGLLESRINAEIKACGLTPEQVLIDPALFLLDNNAFYCVRRYSDTEGEE